MERLVKELIHKTIPYINIYDLSILPILIEELERFVSIEEIRMQWDGQQMIVLYVRNV